MPAHNPLRSANSVMAQRGTGNPVALLDNGSYPGFSNYMNDTWTWNGSDWTQALASFNGPTPTRGDFGLAYDGYAIVMYGGRGQTEMDGCLQDTWLYNGTSWSLQAPATKPFGRYKHEMALITGTLQTVMFGGTNLFDIQKETWHWDGYTKNWSLKSPVHSPPARTDFMFAGGPSNCVLFGGKGTNSLLGDTWTYNGTDWTQAAPATSPSVRACAAMAYDVANSNWVMFGGQNEFDLLPAETWIWNGTTWTKQAPAASPSPRMGHTMCYDSQAGAVLMFGGKDPNQDFCYQDTWKWTGTNWVQL